MKCLECGAAMRVERKTVPYKCGLPGIFLKTEVRNCSKCGAEEIAVPRMGFLHRALASFIINKQGSLTGDEIRFLRKSLGWITGQEFAKHAGVTPETVSRWENGKEPIGATADRFLRLAVAKWQPVENYSVASLDSAGSGKQKGRPVRAVARIQRNDWKLIPA